MLLENDENSKRSVPYLLFLMQPWTGLNKQSLICGKWGDCLNGGDDMHMLAAVAVVLLGACCAGDYWISVSVCAAAPNLLSTC
jgi:hypothetical protein